MSLDSDIKGRMPLFDGENMSFAKWSFVIYAQLRDRSEARLWEDAEQLENFIEGLSSTPVEVEFDEKYKVWNRILFNLMALRVTGSALDEIMRAPSGNGRAAMVLIRERFEPSRLANKFDLMRQLFNTQWRKDQPLEELFNSIDLLAERLSRAKVSVSDEWLAFALLEAIGDETIRLVFVSKAEEATFASLKQLLRESQFGSQLGSKDPKADVLAVSAPWRHSRFREPLRQRKCFRCGSTDHLVRNCTAAAYAGDVAFSVNAPWKPHDRVVLVDSDHVVRKYTAAGYAGDVAFRVNASWKPHDRMFLVDSGATVHLCANMHLFYDWEMEECTLQVASGELLQCHWIGKIRLVVQSRRIVLERVVYHPDAAMNLLSVSRLVQHGHAVQFTENRLTIKCRGGLVLEFPKKENQFFVEDDETVNVVKIANTVQMKVNEHVQLGHYPFDAECSVCLRANLRRPNVRKKKARETPLRLAPFQRISVDLVEVRHPSLSGATLAVTAVCNGTRYVFGHAIKKKSQAAEVIVSMLREQVGVFKTNQLSFGLNSIRTDGGGEFRDEFTRQVARLGYHHRMSAPYVHELNGRIERQNSIIFGTVRALLFEAFFDEDKNSWVSNLCLKLWAEALKVATMRMNLRKSRTNKGLCPLEMLEPMEWKAVVGRLHLFGQPVWLHVCAEERTSRGKLLPRGIPGLWMGYESNSCWETHRIFGAGRLMQVSRNVKFLTLDKHEEWEHKSRVFRAVEEFLASEPSVEVTTGPVFKKPRGRPPKSKMWSQELGKYVEPSETNEQERLDEKAITLETLFDDGAVETEFGDDEDSIDKEEEQVPGCEEIDEDDLQTEEESIDELASEEGQDNSWNSWNVGPRTLVEAGDEDIESEEREASHVGPVKRKRDKTDDKPDDDVSGKRFREHINLAQRVKFDDNIENDQEWVQAIFEELNSLKKSGAVVEVEKDFDSALQTIPSILLLDVKSNLRKKARIVALGNLRVEDGQESFYSSVVSRSGLKLVLAIWQSIMGRDLHLTALDVPTAFLKSKPLEGEFKECLLIPPKELVKLGLVGPSKLFLTKGCIYGMREAPLLWRKTLERELLKLGLVASVMEPNVYISSKCAVATYVDDLLLIGDKSKIAELSEDLVGIFDCKEVASGGLFRFVDLELECAKERLWMHQKEFTKKILMSAGMMECNGSKSLPEAKLLEEKQDYEDTVNDGDHEMLERVIGELIYISTCSRPDLMFVALRLSANLRAPCGRHLEALKKTLRFLKFTENATICFEDVDVKAEKMVVKVFSDSNYGKETFGGCIVQVNGSVVHWKCQKSKIPTCSTTEAEYLASAMALREGEWICNMLQDMGKEVSEKSLFVDNVTVSKILKQEKSNSAVRHTQLEEQYVVYHTARTWKIHRICSQDNLADLLTKTLNGPRHRKLCEMIGLTYK